MARKDQDASRLSFASAWWLVPTIDGVFRMALFALNGGKLSASLSKYNLNEPTKAPGLKMVGLHFTAVVFDFSMVCA